MSDPFQFHVPPQVADRTLLRPDEPGMLMRDMDLGDWLRLIRKHIPLVTFHLEGVVTLGPFAPPPIIRDGTLWAWALQLPFGTTTTTDTDVDLLVNGSAVTSLTLPAGDIFAVDRQLLDLGSSARVVSGDAVNPEVTAAGTGAEDLVMSVWAL